MEDLVSQAFGGAFFGRRVLVTGHTGFKGGWLSLWLQQLGARVFGYALAAPTEPSLHELISPGAFSEERFSDVLKSDALRDTVRQVSPDIVFHLAAQPLVRQSYATPAETFAVNTLGTVNLLEAVRAVGLPCPIVVVTSDKCYENLGWEYGYRENDRLGGNDVYSASKAAAELAAQAWRRSFFDRDPKLGAIATVRGGNVIGGGDYAADRIVPDAVRALLANEAVPVRNPRATRPWQHVLDCLSGYLTVGSRLLDSGNEAPPPEACNFGPGAESDQPVASLIQEFLLQWPGEWDDVSDPDAPHEAARLCLATDRARTLLNWRPTWSFVDTVRNTAEWYRQRHILREHDMIDVSVRQIRSYVEEAARTGIDWAV